MSEEEHELTPEALRAQLGHLRAELRDATEQLRPEDIVTEQVRGGTMQPSSSHEMEDDMAAEEDDEITGESFPILDIPDDVLRPIADYQASYQWSETDRLWIATLPDYRGVIATGETHVACRDDLIEVLRSWLSLGYHLHHDLPVIEGINYAALATV